MHDYRLFISIGTAYLVMNFASIMDYVQALFGFFIAPLFGTVLLGMLWKRVSRSAGFLVLAGTVSSVTMFALMKLDPERWVRIFALSPIAQGLAQDMYQAMWSCVTCVVVTVLVDTGMQAAAGLGISGPGVKLDPAGAGRTRALCRGLCSGA